MAPPWPVPSPSQCFAHHCVDNQGICCGIHQDPHMPLWSPALTASLWGGAENLTRGLCFSLRPSSWCSDSWMLPSPFLFLGDFFLPHEADLRVQAIFSNILLPFSQLKWITWALCLLLALFYIIKAIHVCGWKQFKQYRKVKSKAYVCLILNFPWPRAAMANEFLFWILLVPVLLT